MIPGAAFMASEIDRRTFRVRAEGGRPDLVAGHRLFGRRAAETIPERAGPFGRIRRQHLLKAVGKPEFRDSRRDHLELRRGAKIRLLPPLLPVTAENPKRLRLLRAEAVAGLRAIDFQI